MVVCGDVIAVLSAWHFYVLVEAIERGAMRSDTCLGMFLALGVVGLSPPMIVYLFATADCIQF